MGVIDPSKIDFFTMIPLSRNKIVATTKDLTMLYGEVEPGGGVQKHTHPHQQVGYCLKGTGELWMDGKTYVVKEGYTYSIPSNVKHSWLNKGEEKYVYIEVFYPTREDLLKKKFEEKFWEKES